MLKSLYSMAATTIEKAKPVKRLSKSGMCERQIIVMVACARLCLSRKRILTSFINETQIEVAPRSVCKETSMQSPQPRLDRSRHSLDENS